MQNIAKMNIFYSFSEGSLEQVLPISQFHNHAQYSVRTSGLFGGPHIL